MSRELINQMHRSIEVLNWPKEGDRTALISPKLLARCRAQGIDPNDILRLYGLTYRLCEPMPLTPPTGGG